MPRIPTPGKTPDDIRRERINREIASKRERDKIANRKLAQTKKVDISSTPAIIGDRTANTPPLRIHARRSMRFDKQLSTHTYSVEETGKYWFEDVKQTLAVITHARMIIASRKPLKHNVDDDGKTPFLIT